MEKEFRIPIYGKDLYGESVSLPIRIDASELEHGDVVTVRVDVEDGNNEEE